MTKETPLGGKVVRLVLLILGHRKKKLVSSSRYLVSHSSFYSVIQRHGDKSSGTELKSPLLKQCAYYCIISLFILTSWNISTQNSQAHMHRTSIPEFKTKRDKPNDNQAADLCPTLVPLPCVFSNTHLSLYDY